MTDASPEVEVLGAAWCADTARTLRCLRRLRVPYQATDVDLHLDALQQVADGADVVLASGDAQAELGHGGFSGWGRPA